MKLINRYIGWEWGKWFALTLLFLLSVLFLQNFADDPTFGSDLLSWEGRTKLLLWVLGYLPWLLPISCFVATVACFSFLSKNRELLALLASGCSPAGLSKPLFFIGLFFSILCWASVNFEQKSTFQNKNSNGERDLSSFSMQIAKSRIWYFKELDQVTWRGRDVQVYSYDKNGSDSYRVRAKGAFWSGRGWRFENGRFLGFPSAKGLPVPKDDGVGLNWEKIPDRNDGADISRSSPGINKTFSTLFLALPDDDPRPHAMLLRAPESLGYNELDEIIENYPNKDSAKLYPYRLRRAQLLWSAPSCLFAILCGVAIGFRKKSSSIGSLFGFSLIGILLFYVMKTCFDALGERGVLSEWVAVGSPYLFILTGALFLLAKNR